jgi:thiosulfate dehydrogenase
MRPLPVAAIILVLSLQSFDRSFSQEILEVPPIDYELSGPLIPAKKTIVTAWDLPRNPLTTLTLDSSPPSEMIRRGFRLFVNTPGETPRLSGNMLSCNNCHLNGGQKELSLPLVGVTHRFPEYNKRAGRMFTIQDRIVGCFMRSQNSAAHALGHSAPPKPEENLPSPESEEVLAISAYLEWLSQGYGEGGNPPWRKKNVIAGEHLIPLEKLDSARGEALFIEKCSSCHGVDGQGVQIGDKKAGPLWGPASWNDGAGAARVYTLAGIIRYAMPYLDPGSLTDEEAQQISFFINSKPRPAYPFKAEDYTSEPMPVDAVYYRR